MFRRRPVIVVRRPWRIRRFWRRRGCLFWAISLMALAWLARAGLQNVLN